MTSTDTLRIPIPSELHEHAWLVDSRHPTSDGFVLYVHCAACGTRRVDIAAHPHLPPSALSQELASGR